MGMGPVEPGRQESRTTQDRIEAAVKFHLESAIQSIAKPSGQWGYLDIAAGHITDAKGLLDALMTIKRIDSVKG